MRDLPNFKQVKRRNSKSTPKQKRRRKLRTANFIQNNLTGLREIKDKKNKEKEVRKGKQQSSKQILLVA